MLIPRNVSCSVQSVLCYLINKMGSEDVTEISVFHSVIHSLDKSLWNAGSRYREFGSEHSRLKSQASVRTLGL